MLLNIFKKIAVIIFFGTLLTLAGGKKASATHLVGGEITYECIDSNLHLFKFTLRLYRDCAIGSAEFDTAIYFSVYKTANNAHVLDLKLTRQYRDTLDNATYSYCGFSASHVCVELGFYTGIIFLPPLTPPVTGGYYVMFQKCCRNFQIQNLSPCCANSNQLGAAWYLNIPDYNVAFKNSSPIFKHYPPTVLCYNKDFFFDNSAIDLDGDSLSYQLCNPWNGASITNSTPVPSPSLPVTNINYMATYSATQPLGPLSTININPTTGMLTGHAMVLGRYVIAVCVSEWRNGQLLSTSKRDFQFNIQNCDTTSQAAFNYDVQCNGRVVFTDQSTNINFDSTYHWDFGVTGLNYDTSNLANPIFVYPTGGTYNVTLTINQGHSCESQQVLSINVPNPLLANFGFNKVCVGKPTQFVDSSITNSFAGTITNWQWDFGDGSPFDFTQNPVHYYKGIGPYTVRLFIVSSTGCKDTVVKQVTLYPIPIVNAGSDQSIMIGTSVTLQASGASQYTWSPPTYLSSTTIPNPVCTPDASIVYVVEGTNQYNCRNSDTVEIKLVYPVKIEVPNAFSPNDDGLNDKFYAYNTAGAGFSKYVIKDIDFKIYNRWGELIFETNDINVGWDGTHQKNGQKMEVGVYAWVVTVNTFDGKVIGPLYGNVSLLR